MAIGGITPMQKLAPRAKDFTNRRYRHHGNIDEIEKATNRNKSRVRAKVEHVFGVIKNIFGFRDLLPFFGPLLP